MGEEPGQPIPRYRESGVSARRGIEARRSDSPERFRPWRRAPP